MFLRARENFWDHTTCHPHVCLSKRCSLRVGASQVKMNLSSLSGECCQQPGQQAAGIAAAATEAAGELPGQRQSPGQLRLHDC